MMPFDSEVKEQYECVKSIINDKDVLAVHVTAYGKSLIFHLLPDVFEWYYDVIIIVLFTINFQQHRQRILICMKPVFHYATFFARRKTKEKVASREKSRLVENGIKGLLSRGFPFAH